MQQEHYLILVASLPGPEQEEKDELEQKADSLVGKIPNLDQSRITMVDSGLNSKTADLLAKAWDFPDKENQVNYSDLFTRSSFERGPRKYSETIDSFLKLQQTLFSQNPSIVISTAFVLYSILDLLRVSKDGLTIGKKTSIIVLKKTDSVYKKEFIL